MANLGRKPVVSEGVLCDLRARIVDGQYPVGARMPTRRDLWQKYRTTPVTLQRVFRQLMAEGFVVARGRDGTYVADRPPHLTRFTLVFPYRDRPDRPWPKFWHALAAEAGEVTRTNGHEVTLSFGNERQQDAEIYNRLQADVVARRVAGLIFVTRPFYLRGSPVLETPGVPRVAIASKTEPPNVRAVEVSPDMLDEAIGRVQARGARRIAMVVGQGQVTFAAEALRRRGVDVPSYWVQAAGLGDLVGAAHAAQLLMSAPRSRRPDGLVIADDNLVPAVTAALAESRIRVPGDLKVIGHANFPHVTPSAMPIERIGCDVRDVLRLCLAQLDAQRGGPALPDVVTVPLAQV